MVDMSVDSYEQDLDRLMAPAVEALTYIACPTGAGGSTVQDRLRRVDAMSEAEAKDVLKRCITWAEAAK